MTKYEIILYWSGEDDAFIAGAPELPGCAAEWIATVHELGRSIPEPKGRLLFA